MGSCTQNCGNCGIPIELFSITVDANVSPSVFGCLNGGSLPESTLGYTNYNSNMAGNYTWTKAQSNYAPILDYYTSLNENTREKGNSSYIYKMKPSVDQYGRYIEAVSANSTFSANGNSSNNYVYFPGLATYNENSNIQTKINCKLVECDPNLCNPDPGSCNYFVCQENCSNSWNMNSNFTPGSNTFPDPRSESIQGNSCGGFPSCNPSEGSCTSIKCSSSDIQTLYCFGDVSCGTSTIITDGSITVSSPMSISRAKGFSKSSVDTKMGLLTSNSKLDPCGTRCGSDKDACWGGGFVFTPVDNTNNSYYSRIKVKVAASVEDMKPYSNIQGTVYFYEDSTPGCCGEGNPVFTSNFSLGSQGNFKNGTMVSQDVYNFENDSMQDYVGSSIVACVKINGLTIG